jgi:hypothetical protein
MIGIVFLMSLAFGTVVSIYIGLLVQGGVWTPPTGWLRAKRAGPGPVGGTPVDNGVGKSVLKLGMSPNVIAFGRKRRNGEERLVRDGCICWVKLESQAGKPYWLEICLN